VVENILGQMMPMPAFLGDPNFAGAAAVLAVSLITLFSLAN